jgi:hypothetical protein
MITTAPTWPVLDDTDIWPAPWGPPVRSSRNHVVIVPPSRPKPRQEPDPVRGVALHFGRAFKANLGPKGAPGIKFVVSYGYSVECDRGGAAAAEGGVSVLRTRWTSACARRTM